MLITAEQLRWARIQHSGLLTPFATPESAAAALFGVQAQILPAAALALWQRASGLTYAEVDSRLHATRTLVKLWGQRGTLHLYHTEDWPLLHSALGNRRTWWHSQADKRDDGEAYEQKVLRAAALLVEHKTLTRSQLHHLDATLGKEEFSSWGGVFSDLMYRGVACHAGQEGNEGRFAYREHWLPDLDWVLQERDAANIAIARRYFRAYAPAAESDFRYWRNAKAPESRSWLAHLAEERARLLAEGRDLAAAWVQSSHSAAASYRDFLAAPLGAWVAARLQNQKSKIQNPDVVHDVLAALAEDMLALNREKQTEMRGFLAWLERQIGAQIDALTGKSALQNYLGDYQKCQPPLALAELLAALRKNRRKLHADPDARAFQAPLEREYAASLAKLLPLKARLAATDRLIDLIVYRLYGLTEEEVGIVEGAGAG